jgi:hypothetical protein
MTIRQPDSEPRGRQRIDQWLSADVTVTMLKMALDVVQVVAVVLFLVVVVRALRRRAALPGSLKSQDELVSLIWVANAAVRALDAHDPRQPALVRASSRLGISETSFGTILTSDEIVLLAPFIEEWLAGALPHFLASEHDYSNDTLEKFRARMKQNGMWPVNNAEGQ